MAYVRGSLILETSTTTGNGTLTLAGAKDANFLTFASAVGEGNTCSYSIVASNGQRETGVGTVVGSTLERTTLIASSTGNKLILPAGTHEVGGTANSASWDTDAYTDEMAQDAVGGVLQGCPNILLEYDDATPLITANFLYPLYSPAIIAGAVLIDLNGSIESYFKVSLNANVSAGGITVTGLPTDRSEDVIRVNIRFTQATPGGTLYDVPVTAWSAFGTSRTWDTDWYCYQDATPSIASFESIDGGVTWRAYANTPEDTTLIRQADVDDTPVNGVTTAPVSSNWAYDHAALVTAHGISTVAATVLDDATLADMVNTIGGATSTGTGGLVRATSPTLTTPLLGTPTSGTLTNCTGLPESGLATTDITTGDASTTKHGLAPKAVAPASGLINVLGIANAETAYANKALFDATNPAALGTAAPGSATTAARRDHVHANPAIDTLAAATDITTLNATTTAHGLVVKAVAPDAAQLNVVGIAVGETAYTNKALFDALMPAALGVAAAGSSTIAAHRDHVHAMPSAANVGAAAATSFIAGAGALTGPASPLTIGTAAGAATGDFAAASHNQAETTISFTDVTTGNASTTAHGFSPKTTAPAAGLISVLAIANGETVRSDKALFDTTNAAALGTAAPGTAVIAARRDHVHANPAIDTLAAATDITTLNATTTVHGLAPKAVAPASGLLNVLGIANAETAYANKTIFDGLLKVVILTRAAYNALGPGRPATTLYICNG